MKEFFDVMAPAERIYWYIAIIASIIFLIQTVMTFIGADADTGIDADFDSNLDSGSSAFQLFSLRNLVGFFLGFGWTGASLYNSIDDNLILGIVSFVVGLVFVAVFFLILRSFMKLAEDNTFKVENTIGKTAQVYITIPANKKGRGKISVSVKGSLHELNAITYKDEAIASGELVKIINIQDNILVVEPI